MWSESIKWTWCWLLLLLRSTVGLSLEPSNNQLVTQDGYLIDNNIHGSEPEIPLETFFWTGSGDGPPPMQPPKPMNTLNRDVFIKTSTVLATVYIDGQSPMDEDPLCVYNCDHPKSEDQKLQNRTVAFARSDRRFWLLTIVGGFFSATDIPVVEDQLAKLYRSAFARQQAHHLGLANGSARVNGNTVESPAEDKTVRKGRMVRRRRRDSRSEDEIRPTRVLELDEYRKDLRVEQSLTARQLPMTNIVRVVIHNMTHLTEAELQQRNLDNQVDFIDPKTQSFDRNSNLANQTEFVYTVFVGNKPVLAITAADDMKLVSTEEVMQTIGSSVLTKSEPYLKEPLATPLVPATPTLQQDTNILLYATENPIMFGVLCAAILLLVFLLAGFLLMAKSKRAHSAEIRRLTVERKESDRRTKSGAGDRRPIHKLPTDDPKDGTDNMAFEGDFTDGTRRHKSRKYENPPDIHFPLPPLHRPSSSSSATSDSSVYYNKRYRDEAKNIATDHHEPMFYKKNPHRPHPDDGDRIYAIVSKDSHDGKHNKSKSKNKNRVGSVDNCKAIAEVLSSPSHGSSGDVTYAAPDNYEQMDTFNLREAQKIHERRNQQLKQALYGGGVDDFEIASSVINSPNEAVNREILKALHKSSDQISADSGSIGSFLSMASLKSFPKCSVPEPLSRVLEPVTITNYDQSDHDDRKIHKPSTSSSGAYKRQIINSFVSNEKRNRPRPDDGPFTRTQSDGSDPGIVGPVVWELHKKEMGKQNSPLRDPAKTRNRFEGLLEGAIRLYETNEDQDTGHSRKSNVSFSRNSEATSTTNRGKSAIVTGMRPKMGILRPVTAMVAHNNNGHETPPSPSKGAWRSGAPSPLVRPLSAGPFHRPEMNPANRRLTPQSEAVQLSTAPLIEAIHKELQKFNRSNSNA